MMKCALKDQGSGSKLQGSSQYSNLVILKACLNTYAYTHVLLHVAYMGKLSRYKKQRCLCVQKIMLTCMHSVQDNSIMSVMPLARARPRFLA